MSKHPRQEVREAIAARLKEVKTAAGDKIYISRAIPLFDHNLPAILIYANDEQIREECWDSDGFGPLKRELEIFIEAVTIGREDLDNKLDNLALEIEKALDGWNISDKKAAILRFKGTDLDMSVEGKNTYGAVRLAYSLTYYTQTKQP